MHLSKSSAFSAMRVVPPPDEATTDLAGLLGTLRRNRGRIALFALAGLGLGLVYLALAKPVFTAETSLLIDPRARKIVGEEVLQSGIGVDLAMVESQAALITSDNILRKVVRKLGLDRDVELAPPDIGIVGGLRTLVLGPRAKMNPVDEAVLALSKRIRAKRAQRSYIIDIEVSSSSPVQAAQIADALAAAYLEDQTAAKAAEARGASNLIDARLEEQRAEVQRAEERVDQFKRANRILTVDGALVSEQQLSRLNAELINVRLSAAEAKSRIDQLEAALKSGANPDSFTAAVRSGVIQQLRDQYATAARREAALSGQLLPRHPQVVEARAQVAEVRSQIQAELRRLVAATRSEFEVARNREREIERAVEEAKSETVRMQTAQIRLRELERDQDSSRSLLNAYLTRGKETREQQNIATPEARVITPAIVPVKPSRPIPWLVLSIGLLGGLALGVSRALVSDHLSRSAAAGRSNGPAGLRNIGRLPAVVPGSRLARLFRRWRSASGRTQPVAYGVLMDAVAGGSSRDASFRAAVHRLLGLVTVHSRTGRGTTVALLSAGRGQGTTGTALAMAFASALKGERTLLVDLAAADATLSDLLAPDIHVDLSSTVELRRQLADLVTTDTRSKLAFLPLAHGDLDTLRRSQRRLVAQALKALSAGYDLTIIDGGAVLVDESSLPFAAECDYVLLVTRKDTADEGDFDQVVRLLDAASTRIAGAVVTMD